MSTDHKTAEKAVGACYSTWSQTYYDEYYGAQASYPPVHRDLLKRLLAEANARTVLDAGCGPASFLRDLAETGAGRYGFDLTPEMVAEARRIGVFPHIPRDADVTVMQHLCSAVKPGGLVVIEARNQLFSLFTLNRISCEFFLNDLIPVESLRRESGDAAAGLERAVEEIRQHFRMDLPPVRTGKAGEPGYDEVLSRSHNPLVLREQFAAAGFTNVRLLFYHYHCLPPMTASHAPELFRKQSVAMETPEDWRGYFMASAFLLAGTRA